MIDITTKGYDIFDLDESDKEFLRTFKDASKRINGGMTCLDTIWQPTLVYELDEYTDESYNKQRNQWLAEYGNSVFQSWFTIETDFNYPKSIELFNRIFSKYYSIDATTVKHNFMHTLFNKDCFIKDHTDGGDSDRIAGLLIYLNEDYDKNNGGCLIVTDTQAGDEIEVVPELGRVVVLDYTKNQIPHEVTRVIEGERYAICNFIHYNIQHNDNQRTKES